MVSSENLSISSSRPNHRISISVYEPPLSTGGLIPVVVMAHGIGAIKEAGLEPFAAAFVGAGYAAITFDYLHFGMSDGQPRGLLSVPQELRDCKDVIAWVRQQPRRFDINRIVFWGSSFGGMHVASLLAEDHGLAAGIAQCPCVDGLGASLQIPLVTTMRLISAALLDYLSSFFSDTPVYIPLAGDSSTLALMMGEEVVEGWARITPREGVDFPNRIAARSILSLSFNRPFLKLHRSVKPLLVVLPTWDHQAPLGAAEDAVRRAPLGESLRVSGGHFDLYKWGPSYTENLNGQLSFLKRVIG